MKTLFFISCMYFLLAGKTTTQVANSKPFKFVADDTVSVNGHWYLQPVLPSDTATGSIPFLQVNLSAGNFTGNTGCNSMRGSFQKTDSSFIFDKDMITTKMFCAGYDEAAFIRSLLRTNHYKFEKGILILMFNVTELSRWTRKPDRQIKINKA